MKFLKFLFFALIGLSLLVIVAFLSMPLALLCKSVGMFETYLALTSSVGEAIRSKFQEWIEGV